MRLIDGDGPKILRPDLAGVRSINEALRSGLGEAEDVLVETVQKARVLSAVRNEADAALRSKFGMEDHA